MTANSSPYQVVVDPAQFEPPGALVVRIPVGVRRKKQLLGILARQLNFPDYFGWNWDALDECLRDLSWLPAGKIVLVHEALPFSEKGENRATYLAILQSAMKHWRATGKRSDRLAVVIPPASPSAG